MADKLLKYSFPLQIFGFILLVLVGILITKMENGLNDRFLAFYFIYLIYALVIIIFYTEEGKIFNSNFESNSMLKLRMNHALNLSLPPIIMALSIFIFLPSESDVKLWAIGAFLFIYGGIYFAKGYYRRYKELDQIEVINKLCKNAETETQHVRKAR